MDALVSASWLDANLSRADLVVLDASKHLPAAGRDPHTEFEAAHIPGARFLDLDSLFDADSDVPSAIPTATQFARRMRQLGVNIGDRLVFYDDSDIHSSARAWFIARLYGVQHAAILDGGMHKWRQEAFSLESGSAESGAGNFEAREGSGAVASKADVLSSLDDPRSQVLDARGMPRFRGEKPEDHAGVAPGRIPASYNLPHGELFARDNTFLGKDEIATAFQRAGIDLDRPVTTTCGSGVTASVLIFAAHMLGHDDFALYDGSWSEWGADPATPKATGDAA